MKIILAILVFILSGCSTTYPTVTEYRIDPSVKIEKHSGISKKYSIKVSPVFLNASLTSNTMRYRIGKYKEYSFSESVWVDYPNRVIANKLVAVLDASGLFNGVYSYKSSKSAELVLEVSLNEFIQSFNEAEDSSTVTLDISYNLIEKKNAKLIGSKNFRKTMKTERVDAQGGVEALNILLAQTLQETIDWLSEKL